MTTHPIISTGQTQCQRILAMLESSVEEWVPMPLLAKDSGAYAVHSRVADLRRQGHRIDHRGERSGRTVRSYYRLSMKPKA